MTTDKDTKIAKGTRLVTTKAYADTKDTMLVTTKA